MCKCKTILTPMVPVRSSEGDTGTTPAPDGGSEAQGTGAVGGGAGTQVQTI